MPPIFPTKQDCFYVLEMLDAYLIDFSYTQPWAGKLISDSDNPPIWLGELLITRSQNHQIKTIREYALSEPLESEPINLEKFHVGCLWLRYERREISWAVFLKLAGEYLDVFNGNWFCELPYYYLNRYEADYFTEVAESETKEGLLSDLDLKPWINTARSKFEPFLAHRISTKSESI